jgi:hypothetical protein
MLVGGDAESVNIASGTADNAIQNNFAFIPPMVVAGMRACVVSAPCMAAASALAIKTGQKLEEALKTISYSAYSNNMDVTEVAEGFVDQGMDTNPGKPSILSTPINEPNAKDYVESYPAAEKQDTTLITLPPTDAPDMNKEGYSILPDWLTKGWNVLFKDADVKTLDVGTYGELAPNSAKDGLTPDHIPSFAAIRETREAELGRELSAGEERELRNTTNCIVYGTCTHQQESRTYGGRNTQTQIQQDAKNLLAAQERDLQAIRSALINEGNTPQDVDAAFNRLRELNKK